MSEASLDPPGARERWNRRYAARGVRVFSGAPSEWLTENRSVLSGSGGRRALDVACGDGRNAAYLARLGFEVDAVDISDVVIDALQAAAIHRGLAVNALRLDLERDPLPGSDYDLVVQLNYLQRSLFEPIAQALTPGGILILETVTRAHVEELGNQFDPRFLLDHNELLGSFPGLEVLRYEECVAERSGRPRAVASLVARRRAVTVSSGRNGMLAIATLSLERADPDAARFRAGAAGSRAQLGRRPALRADGGAVRCPTGKRQAAR